MDKVCIGIPCYGTQSQQFWLPMVRELLAASKKYGIDIVLGDNPIVMTTMATDFNRNIIYRKFLDDFPTTEWLWWWDADNNNPLGTLRELLDHQKTLIEALYYRRDLKNPLPIAYLRTPNGRYEPIKNWNQGEILPVDAGGMNSLLTHRSVYEDLEMKYISLMRPNGSILPVHVDDIKGDVFDDVELPTDNRIINGVLHQRLRVPDEEKLIRPPLFALEYGRTEDMPFFEMAQRIGHQLYVDTGIECKHNQEIGIGGMHYRQFVKEQNEAKKVQEVIHGKPN